MNNGFNMSSILGSLESISRGARAAATRRRARELAAEIEGRGNVRRSSRQAAIREAKSLIATAEANVNMGPTASSSSSSSNWGGEGAPVYGTNYSVARGAENRPPRAVSVSRRSKAPERRNRNYNRNGITRRNNQRAHSRERYEKPANRTQNSRRRNNRPASETVAPGKKKSLYDQVIYILSKKDEPLNANNRKRSFQLSHYVRQLEEFNTFLDENPRNAHREEIMDAIGVLQMKLGVLPGPAAMTNNSTSATAAAVSSRNNSGLPAGLFPKDRTIYELLKIREYMERRATTGPAAASANATRRNRSENFRRFLGMLYASAQYHISHLDPANDSLDALHLHSGIQFLDELNANAGGVAERPPSPEQRAEANAIINELADALAGTMIGPAALNNSNL
jgi:hypothetical protein